MNYFLKNGDEIIADNIKLVYNNGDFILPEDGLEYAVKYVFDVETELECDVLFKMVKGTPKPYYNKPLIT